MSLLDTGHTPVSNETDRDPTPPRRESVALTRRRVVSRPESVPNYVRRRAPSRGRAVGLAELGGPVPGHAVVSAAAASFGTTDMMEIVLGDDDRAVVSDPLDVPWRHICALRIVSQSGKEYVGTGWFVGPKTLLTAGHCVYLHDDGGWPRSIKVIPALNGAVEPFGEIVSTQFRTTEAWKTKQDTNYDYGAILIGDALGDDAGWFGVAVLGDADLETNDANIAGYPYDRDQATRQYFHARRISSLSPQKLFYEIDTYGGQSGSPVWFNMVDGQRVAIGIHTTGSSTSNSGTRITADIFNNVSRWTGAMDATTPMAAVTPVTLPIVATPRPTRRSALVRGGRR